MVRLFRLLVPPGRASAHAIPNGGRRYAREAERPREQGAVSGMPDLVLITAGAAVRWIELKWSKNRILKLAVGRLSEAQKEVHRRLRALGYQTDTIDDLDQFMALLRESGLTTYAGKAPAPAAEAAAENPPRAALRSGPSPLP